MFDIYRNKQLVQKLLRKINSLASGRRMKIMHVCGTHENSICKYGIRGLLPENVEIVTGPGCPVCVCPVQDIDAAIQIAEKPDTILATFGDMIRVPGSSQVSLSGIKGEGADIRIVYSPFDAAKLAEDNPNSEVVFFAVGFETTAAGVAALIHSVPPQNFSLLCSHRMIIPAMELLMGIGDTKIDGFLLPGHVTVITGLKPFELFPIAYRMPVVTAGFEPVDVVRGVVSIIEQIDKKEPVLGNVYERAVSDDGNKKAQGFMTEVFDTVSSYWRGIGRIPGSGLQLKTEYKRYDALSKFDIKQPETITDIHPGCSCHLIMIGKITPDGCSMFKNACTPESPYGPCMVSCEGTCKIWYEYG